jgi:hypothetical protein
VLIVMPGSSCSIGKGVAQARQTSKQGTRRTVRVTEFGKRVKKIRITASFLLTAVGFGGTV